MVILLLFTKILNVLINFRWKWSMVSHTARRGGRISTKFMKRIKEEARSLLKFQTVSRTRWVFFYVDVLHFFLILGLIWTFFFINPDLSKEDENEGTKAALEYKVRSAISMHGSGFCVKIIWMWFSRTAAVIKLNIKVKKPQIRQWGTPAYEQIF